jgi:hypothetical protein
MPFLIETREVHQLALDFAHEVSMITQALPRSHPLLELARGSGLVTLLQHQEFYARLERISRVLSGLIR